jgi:hypothetical protein
VQAAAATQHEALEAELAADRAAGEGVAAELRACAAQEAEVQGRLRARNEAVTTAEVRAQQARDQAAEADQELGALAERLGLAAEPSEEPLPDEEVVQLRQRIERLQRRREQLGPVNPLAKAEYDEALAHVEELETQRTDLETALRELKGVIRDTDSRSARRSRRRSPPRPRTSRSSPSSSSPAAAAGCARARGRRPAPVLGGAEPEEPGTTTAPSDEEAAPRQEEAEEEDLLGVEIEITPAGKSMKRLTLLSGGEKSMTAIAFLFAVFLAKPCPFYILDEVEAALDDANISRFLRLLEKYADRAQFIVVTHQKRTMEAADTLYGVSMGDDGVSKVVSRHLPREVPAEPRPDGQARATQGPGRRPRGRRAPRAVERPRARAGARRRPTPGRRPAEDGDERPPEPPRSGRRPRAARGHRVRRGGGHALPPLPVDAAAGQGADARATGCRARTCRTPTRSRRSSGRGRSSSTTRSWPRARCSRGCATSRSARRTRGARAQVEREQQRAADLRRQLDGRAAPP